MPDQGAKSVLHLTRLFEAPRKAVFQAWTDSGSLAQWWGPDAFTAPSVVSEPNPGGRLDIVMRGPDGVDNPMTGVFKKVVAPELIVFETSPVGKDGRPALLSKNEVKFTSIGDKTRIDLAVDATGFIPEAKAMLDGMPAGWNQSLQCLDDFLSGAHERRIMIPRLLPTSCEKTFAAWIERDKVKQWWGPDGFTITLEEMDVRPGGIWQFMMHGPDGRDYPNRNRYREVHRPTRLVFEHERPRFLTTVTFDSMVGQTALTMRLVFPSKEQRDAAVETFNAIEGSNQTLNRLRDFLQQSPPP